MANKRITDLNNAGSLRGDEKFIVDQVTPSCVSGQDTVNTNLTDIQKFVLTNAPLISSTGDMEVDGNAIIDGTVNIGGTVKTNSSLTTDSLTVTKNITTASGKILSAGEDIYDIFYPGLSGLSKFPLNTS